MQQRRPGAGRVLRHDEVRAGSGSASRHIRRVFAAADVPSGLPTRLLPDRTSTPDLHDPDRSQDGRHVRPRRHRLEAGCGGTAASTEGVGIRADLDPVMTEIVLAVTSGMGMDDASDAAADRMGLARDADGLSGGGGQGWSPNWSAWGCWSSPRLKSSGRGDSFTAGSTTGSRPLCLHPCRARCASRDASRTMDGMTAVNDHGATHRCLPRLSLTGPDPRPTGRGARRRRADRGDPAVHRQDLAGAAHCHTRRRRCCRGGGHGSPNSPGPPPIRPTGRPCCCDCTMRSSITPTP